MKKFNVFLVIIILLAYNKLSYAWWWNTHQAITELSLTGITGEKLAEKIASYADTPDKDSVEAFFCHRVTQYEEDFCKKAKYEESERKKKYPGFPKGSEQGAFLWAKVAKKNFKDNPNGEEWKKYFGYATHFLADALCPPHCRPWAEGLGGHTAFEEKFELGGLRPYYGTLQGKEIDKRIMEGDIIGWITEKAAEVYKMPQKYVQEGDREKGWAIVEKGQTTPVEKFDPFLIPLRSDAYAMIYTFEKDNIEKILRWIGESIRGLYFYVTKEEVVLEGEIVAGELLFNYQDKEIKNLIPLVMFSDGKYSSALNVLRTNNALKQKILNIDKFWLYYKGALIGSFKVGGFLSEGEMGMPSFMGKIYWDAKPTVELSLIAENTIALSHLIPQPFFPQNPFLNTKQKLGLDRITQETLIRPKAWYRKLGLKNPPELIGKSPKRSFIKAFIVEQGGPLIVYSNVRWAGKPCAEIYASVFAIWSGRWEILKRSTNLSECPVGESVGDNAFFVSLLGDMDGDGVAELVINEGRWENWKKALYKITNGRLTKLLDIGDYGS